MSDLPPTETTDARFRDLDSWSDGEILSALWEAQATAVAAVRPALAAIAESARASALRLERGGRLCYAGAGTSGRIAAQDLAELEPTFGWPLARTGLLLAGGLAALSASVEGAEDDAEAAHAAIAACPVGPDDVLIGVAASGSTPFTLACVEFARTLGVLTIAVTNAPSSRLALASDYAIVADTGAEPIAGSTRLKAGTAQKIMLNLLSTLIMVRLGRVHDGFMVDMQPRNEKLRLRAERMVQHMTGCDRAAAREALAAVGWNVKRAVLHRSGLSAVQIEALLDRHHGSLRAALAEADG